MNIVRFQGETPSVYYEFDKDSTPLGEGGMGCVYSGYRVDTAYNLQSIVAIKCIKPELSGNQMIIQRAQREGSVQISHPNLIRMYGFFSGAEINQYTNSYVPTYYLAMEQLCGINLDDIVFRGLTQNSFGEELPLARTILEEYVNNRERCAVFIIQEVLNGLAALHRAGFIHRDLDPSNLMLTQDGHIKIIDFGISKNIGGVAMDSLTQSGQFVGKYAYASPELLLGDLKNQNAHTDIYAVGIMFYQFLTGFLPVQGSSMEIMQAHLSGDLNYSPISNRTIRKIIQKATKKNSSARYKSAEEMLVAMQGIVFSPRPTVVTGTETPQHPVTTTSTVLNNEMSVNNYQQVSEQKEDVTVSETAMGTVVESKTSANESDTRSAITDTGVSEISGKFDSLPWWVTAVCVVAGLFTGIMLGVLQNGF